jgi:hypothetical protein
LALSLTSLRGSKWTKTDGLGSLIIALRFNTQLIRVATWDSTRSVISTSSTRPSWSRRLTRISLWRVAGLRGSRWLWGTRFRLNPTS